MEFISNKFIEETFVTDHINEKCLYGYLKGSGHSVRILPTNEDENHIYLYYFQLGNKETFSRWANSTDFVLKVIDYNIMTNKPIRNKEEKIKAIEEDIKKGIDLAKLLFSTVPVNYWNDGLRVEY